MPVLVDIFCKRTTMGCTSCAYIIGKKKNIPEVSVFIPCFCVPVQSDIHKTLRGLIPKDLIDRITSIRNQIAFVAEDTGGSAVGELQKALEKYLPLVLGLTKKEYGLQQLVEFKWKKVKNDGREEVLMVLDSWFELLGVVEMMSVVKLMEANEKLISK